MVGLVKGDRIYSLYSIKTITIMESTNQTCVRVCVRTRVQA